MRATRGRTALKEKLKRMGWSQGDLARELKVDAGVVSRWVRGERVPELVFALGIQTATGIDPVLWTQDEDEDESDRGAA